MDKKEIVGYIAASTAGATLAKVVTLIPTSTKTVPFIASLSKPVPYLLVPTWQLYCFGILMIIGMLASHLPAGGKEK